MAREITGLGSLRSGGVNFLPIFYRPAESRHERARVEIGKVLIHVVLALPRSCSLTCKPACRAGSQDCECLRKTTPGACNSVSLNRFDQECQVCPRRAIPDFRLSESTS